MNDYFINDVENLEIEDPYADNNTSNCLEKFQNHPSILKIKEVYKITECFSFKNVVTNDVELIIKGLNKKSATAYYDIPVKILEKNGDIVSPIITKI